MQERETSGNGIFLILLVSSKLDLFNWLEHPALPLALVPVPWPSIGLSPIPGKVLSTLAPEPKFILCVEWLFAPPETGAQDDLLCSQMSKRNRWLLPWPTVAQEFVLVSWLLPDQHLERSPESSHLPPKVTLNHPATTGLAPYIWDHTAPWWMLFFLPGDPCSLTPQVAPTYLCRWGLNCNLPILWQT